MLSLKRISAWCFIICFATLIPSVRYIKVTDELAALVLFGLMLLACIVNGQWRRYSLLWIVIGTVAFYTVYSLTMVSYNSRMAILTDAIIEIKPFIPFIAFLIIKPAFSTTERRLIAITAITNCLICVTALACGMPGIRPVVNHPAYAGAFIFISIIVLCYLYSDVRIRVPRHVLIFSCIMLTAGLMCGRSKYYGYMILFIFFMFFYTPGITRALSVKRISMIGAFVILILAVSWNKFSYYYLTGGSSRFDPDVIESFARPVLYITGFSIMADHFPFGSGLASFASFPSSNPYSSLYHEYGIDKVYGLSEANSDFICDAYYPLLAQFGIIGVILFAALFIYIYRLLIRYTRILGVRGRLPFALGMLTVGFILIECTGSTMLVQPGGQIAMMLLGLICAGAPESQPTVSEKTNQSVIYG